MILHHPFIITSWLKPGVKIGDDTLTLVEFAPSHDRRQRATFCIDFAADGSGHPIPNYVDSGCGSAPGGFRSYVEAFNLFLTFMTACGESMRSSRSTGRKGENADLFPLHIAEWIEDHMQEIQNVACDLLIEDGNGELNHKLIEV